MANNNFWPGISVMVLVFGMVLSGCASVQETSGFMDGRKPIQVISEINSDSSKIGTLTSRVYLGIFGETIYPSIADTAKAGDITKIATVEYYKRPGIFNIWTDYTTIVTGE